MDVRVVEHTEQLSHVALSGRLDIAGVQAVEIRFLALTVTRGKPAIVDISEVTFIASIGIGMLVGAAKALQRRSAKMVLLGPQGMVETTLRAASIDTAIPFAEGLEQAMRVLAAA